MIKALKYLLAVIRWRFFEKPQYIGRRAYVLGKIREIDGESYANFFVKGVNTTLKKSDYYFNGVVYKSIYNLS